MPRSKPKEVIEHRVTLGDFERKQLKEAQTARTIRDVGIGVGIVGLGVGGSYVGYKIGKAILDWGEDAVDMVKEEISKLNPVPIFTGDRPLPEADPNFEGRNDGWIFGGKPTIFQVAWENTFG
jgi:hypothetical protein